MNLTTQLEQLIFNLSLSSSPTPDDIYELHQDNLTTDSQQNLVLPHSDLDHNGGEVHEGGFLSGHNPFQFSADVPLPTFTIQLLVIACMSRLVKFILSPIRQPAVIAEIISGILLGPTAMGQIPSFTSTIFPPPSLPFLNLMSNFGLVLFLFLVGLELNPSILRKSLTKSFLISFFGMVLPFLLGCGSSYILYTYIEPPPSPLTPTPKNFPSYLLFLGVAMSITAFPVLARILTEMNLLKTKVGSLTVSSACVDDTTSWCLLALVISIIHADSYLSALYVFLMGIAYTAILIIIVRPIFIAYLQKSGVFDQEQPSQTSIFCALMLVFISAFITEAIGIHAIFGGFLVGIIMPHERGFAYHLTEKLEDFVQIVFLPLYFALSGLKTEITALDDPLSWAVVLLVIFCASFGKIVGCSLAARVMGMKWRECFAVGAMMNCKGLVELIVLNLGYDAGIICDKTFCIMVIMALVTTFMTVPMVTWVYPKEMQEVVEEEGEGERVRRPKEKSLLVSVNRIEQVGPLLSVVNLLQCQMNGERRLRESKGVDVGEGVGADGVGNGNGQGQGHGHGQGLKGISKLADLINIMPGGGQGGFLMGQRKGGGGGGVQINVLRLIELTDRDSSVMLSANQKALANDPITKLLKSFCEATNKRNRVEGMVRVVNMGMFGKVLAGAGEEVNAGFILLPWSGAGSMVEERVERGMRRFSLVGGMGGLGGGGGGGRRLSIHTASQHSSFFQDLLGEAKRNVVIYVDRGKGHLGGGDEGCGGVIYVPFFGGEDDRLVLDIAMGVREMGEGVRVKVVRYKNSKGRYWERFSVVERDEEMEEGDEEEEREGGVQQVAIQVEDKEDEEAIKRWFGEGEAQEQDNCELGVEFEVVECPSPVAQALHHLRGLRGCDLVMIGRGSLQRTGAGGGGGEEEKGFPFRMGDGERRQVLGEFAEAAMGSQCKASMLVVQSGKKNAKKE